MNVDTFLNMSVNDAVDLLVESKYYQPNHVVGDLAIQLHGYSMKPYNGVGDEVLHPIRSKQTVKIALSKIEGDFNITQIVKFFNSKGEVNDNIYI